MYRFAYRPRWILTHIVIVCIGTLCAAAGLWQLDRLDGRRERNALLVSRSGASPIPVEEVDPAQAEYRGVVVTGTYVPEEEVLLLGRERNGLAGNHVLTPVMLEDGTLVIVDRGWVPATMDTTPVTGAAPQPGQVVVEGIARQTQHETRFGPRNPPEGELDKIVLVDTERLASQMPARLRPVWVMLAKQTPSQQDAPIRRDLPAPPELPAPSEGRHLFYAIQWFSFVPIGLTGYAFILRREARRRAASPDRTADPDREPSPAP